MMRLLLVVLAMTSMAMAQEVRFYGEGEILGHTFVLARVDGEAFASEREVFITFNRDMTVAGSVCNRFHGPFGVDGFILKAEVASTRMLCPQENLSALENAFFQALRSGAAMVAAGDRLELRRDDRVWEFRRAEAEADAGEAAKPAESSAAAALSWKDLIGKFTLATVDGKTFSVEMGKHPYIQFGEDMRVGGSACNNFTGPGELSGNTLTIKNAASTMMMCVDQKLAQYERDFHQLLQSGAAMTLDGETLTLSNNGKTYVYHQEK